ATWGRPWPLKSATTISVMLSVRAGPRNVQCWPGAGTIFQASSTMPKTSVRPSPVKSPKRRDGVRYEEKAKKSHGPVPADDHVHSVPLATNRSARPSPSKSPMARLEMVQNSAVVLSRNQREPPAHDTSTSLPCSRITSVRPSPSKSPKRSSEARSAMRLRKRHSVLPPAENHQPAPVPRNRSSTPSPSKSPTPKSPLEHVCDGSGQMEVGLGTSKTLLAVPTRISASSPGTKGSPFDIAQIGTSTSGGTHGHAPAISSPV